MVFITTEDCGSYCCFRILFSPSPIRACVPRSSLHIVYLFTELLTQCRRKEEKEIEISPENCEVIQPYIFGSPTTPQISAINHNQSRPHLGYIAYYWLRRPLANSDWTMSLKHCSWMKHNQFDCREQRSPWSWVK